MVADEVHVVAGLDEMKMQVVAVPTSFRPPLVLAESGAAHEGLPDPIWNRHSSGRQATRRGPHRVAVVPKSSRRSGADAAPAECDEETKSGHRENRGRRLRNRNRRDVGFRIVDR